MREPQVTNPWSGKIPHTVEQLSPRAQLLSLRSGACKPVLLAFMCPRALMIPSERSHSSEEPMHHDEEQVLSRN